MSKRKNKKKDNIFFRHKKFFYGLIFVLSTAIIFLPLFLKIPLREFRFLGLFGVFLVNFLGSATVFLPSPSILSVGYAGNIYNPVIVALIASIGSSLGESVGFLFGHSSREVLNFRKHNILYGLLSFFSEKYGVYVILLFSIIPNPIFDGVGILVGLSSYSLRKFLFLVFLGRFVRNLAIASFGHIL